MPLDKIFTIEHNLHKFKKISIKYYILRKQNKNFLTVLITFSLIYLLKQTFYMKNTNLKMPFVIFEMRKMPEVVPITTFRLIL